jgi:hypothetical protein
MKGLSHLRSPDRKSMFARARVIPLGVDPKQNAEGRMPTHPTCVRLEMSEALDMLCSTGTVPVHETIGRTKWHFK